MAGVRRQRLGDCPSCSPADPVTKQKVHDGTIVAYLLKSGKRDAVKELKDGSFQCRECGRVIGKRSIETRPEVNMFDVDEKKSYEYIDTRSAKVVHDAIYDGLSKDDIDNVNKAHRLVKAWLAWLTGVKDSASVQDESLSDSVKSFHVYLIKNPPEDTDNIPKEAKIRRIGASRRKRSLKGREGDGAERAGVTSEGGQPAVEPHGATDDTEDELPAIPSADVEAAFLPGFNQTLWNKRWARMKAVYQAWNRRADIRKATLRKALLERRTELDRAWLVAAVYIVVNCDQSQYVTVQDVVDACMVTGTARMRVRTVKECIDCLWPEQVHIRVRRIIVAGSMTRWLRGGLDFDINALDAIAVDLVQPEALFEAYGVDRVFTASSADGLAATNGGGGRVSAVGHLVNLTPNRDGLDALLHEDDIIRIIVEVSPPIREFISIALYHLMDSGKELLLLPDATSRERIGHCVFFLLWVVFLRSQPHAGKGHRTANGDLLYSLMVAVIGSGRPLAHGAMPKSFYRVGMRQRESSMSSGGVMTSHLTRVCARDGPSVSDLLEQFEAAYSQLGEVMIRLDKLLKHRHARIAVRVDSFLGSYSFMEEVKKERQRRQTTGQKVT